MRSVVYKQPGVVVTEESPQPTLASRDILVRVDACGVCGSDLASFVDGHYIEAEQVMGHEIAGRIASVGAEHDPLVVGARVTIRPMRSCGECSYCLEGDSHLCDNTLGPSLGYGTPGGFSDHVVVADARLGIDVFRVGDEIDPLDLLWAEPLAVAIHAVGQIGRPVKQILVVGAGAVGLTLIAAAASTGIRVTSVEPISDRRDAATRLGAEAYAPGNLDSGQRFDAVLDASGVPAAVSAALPHLTPGAPIVLVGLSDSAIDYPTGGHPVIGAFAYRQTDFERAVELILTGAARLGQFISHSYDLGDAALALRAPQPGEQIVKVAIVPQKGTP